MRNNPTRMAELLLGLAALLGPTFNAGAQIPQAETEPATQIKIARDQFEHNDLAGAEKTLWSVLSTGPSNEAALTLLGMIRGRQERYSESEALFRRVLQINPKSIVAGKNLITALVAQEKIDDAIDASQKLAKVLPEDVDLKIELARLYFRRGEYDAALSSIAGLPSRSLPPTAVPVKAASLLGLGRKSDAVALIPQARAHSAVALELARVFLDANLPDEALKCLPVSAPTTKQAAAAYYELKGKALGSKGQFSPAISNFRSALALNPQSTDTLLGIAKIYTAQNNHSEAVDLLQRAHTLAPDSLPVLRLLIIEALKSGQRKLALRTAYELQQKSPDNLDDMYLNGATMLEVHEYGPTVAIFEKYVGQRPNEPKAQLGLGMAYLSQQRYADAKRALQRATQMDPDMSEAYYQLGMADGKQGNVQEAIQDFERVLQLQPGHAKALVSLGTLYLQQGDMDKAKTALVRGAAADPTNPDVEYQLSLLFSRAGNSAEARQHMDRFRKLKAGSAAAGKEQVSQESVER
jgi:tetratricopeptide (TPR) repeat protein